MKLFKRKQTILTAPVSGKIISLEQVPDPVFAKKMMGDGIAVISESKYVVAPADGVLTLFADTLHAFGMRLDNGAEVFIHVGLETVSLGGHGFTPLVKEQTYVSKGTPVLALDLDYFKQANISLITPIIIINSQEHPIQNHIEKDFAIMGESDILTIK